MSTLIAAQNSTAVSLVNATETALVTVGPVVQVRDSYPILLIFSGRFVMGVGDSSYNYTIRRGPLGTVADPALAPVINDNLPAPSSGAVRNYSFMILDSGSILGPVLYTLTLTRLGGADTRASVVQALAALMLF